MPDTGHNRTIRAFHRGHVQEGADIDDFARANQIGQKSRLGHIGDVGRIVGVNPDVDGSLEILGALILDIDAGRFFKGSE